MKWDDVARKWGTDKSSEFHGYMDEYQDILKDKKIDRLLEIGCAHGKSLWMWHELFPDSLIVGCDILPECRLHQRKDIAVLIADASDPTKMAAVSQLHGPFDAIVDDGEHEWHQINMAFEELYPRMADGGVYFIEDMDNDEHTRDFCDRWGGSYIECKNKGLIIVRHL